MMKDIVATLLPFAISAATYAATRNNQPKGSQPMTCEGDPKSEGTQGVNGRGTLPELHLVGRDTWDGSPVSTEANL